MLFISIICTFLAILYLFYRKYLHYRAVIDRIPGPKVASLLLGNLNIFLKPSNVSRNDFLKMFHPKAWNLFQQFRDEGLVRLWFGPFNVAYLLTNAKFAESLLTSNKNVNKGMEYHFFSPLFGDGLMASEANVWRARRKMLSSAYYYKLLKNFIPIFTRHTEKLLKFIDATATDGPSNSGPKCAVIKDVRAMFEILALDIVKETAMGTDLERDTVMDSETYRVVLKNIFRAILNRLQNPFYWIGWIYCCTKAGRNFYENMDILQDYFNQAVKRQTEKYHHKQENNHEQASKQRPTKFMDILLENYFKVNQKYDKIINPKMLEYEVHTFIVAGHETVSLTLTFALLMIGWYNEVQDAVHAELTSIFQDNPHEDTKIEDLQKMHYLEMCIKETLRLFPPGQFIGRQLTDAIVFPNGVSLPAGCSCYIPIMYLHKDPEHFSEPDNFVPERFAPSNRMPNPFAYIPFSAGPRNCIGQKYAILELKFILAQILRKYRVFSKTNYRDILWGMAPMLKPVNKIQIEFRKISI